MSVEDALESSSEDDLNPDMLENDEDWSKLSNVSSDHPYPTYQVGGVDKGVGLLKVKETPEMEKELLVVYEFVSAGEDEIYTNIAGEAPDIHTIDLPHNQFDDRESAKDYLEFVMDYGVENILREYGLRSAKNRNI